MVYANTSKRLLGEAVMEKKNSNGKKEGLELHKPARPLRFVKDKDGNGWLCDNNVDLEKDLKDQGCWRCDEIAFPCGGR